MLIDKFSVDKIYIFYFLKLRFHLLILLLLSVVSAMSGEEDRLWSIVKANSSDFNAWTALLEETEKLAEVFLFKD